MVIKGTRPLSLVVKFGILYGTFLLVRIDLTMALRFIATFIESGLIRYISVSSVN